MNLLDFAAKAPRTTGKPCWCCGLPERKEIDSAYQRGVGAAVIQRWLVEEKGYKPADVTRNRIYGHLQNHVTKVMSLAVKRRKAA